MDFLLNNHRSYIRYRNTFNNLIITFQYLFENRNIFLTFTKKTTALDEG